MKTKFLIIIGIILIVGVIAVTVISQNQLELNKVTTENLSNLNPIQREEFIMEYTETYFNGEFNDHAEIIDLQKDYGVGEPITFTVATWGYGHPCQSPSFVYYYETKNPENIVFEDRFVRWCQALKESDFIYFYQELDSSRTAKASESDIFPVFDKPGSYIISVDDKMDYEFQIFEKVIVDIPTYEMNRNELSQVLDYCNSTGFKDAILYNYSNETHSIDNNTCKWKEHVTYPNTDHLCVPYSDKWVTGEEIRNQTHIFDKNRCIWKIDQNYDTVNSKGCPQFCPKDDSPIKINVTRGAPLVILDEESQNKSLDNYSVKELLENPFLIPIRDSSENRVSLYSDRDESVFACASVSLERIADDQLHYYLKENQTSPHFFPMTEDDLNTHPEVKLLIAASNLLEFPYNDRVHVNFDGVDFVEYEFYLIDKIIEKYGGTRGDYITLDSDYEKRLTNSKKDGFTNYFEAPRIIYNDKIFMLDGTYFWTSDENNLRMGLQLTDSVHEKRKSIELTDEDMIYLPKIKEALNGMRKIQENIHANIGVPENPDWNDYREWYSNKMTDDMKHGYDFSGFTFDGQFYELNFTIC